jgi:NADPH2:quinone reductase
MGAAKTMRAAQVHELVGIEGLHVTDANVPTPGEDEVLVLVHSVGLSFADLLMSRGTYQLLPPAPFTIGMDLAGEVAAVGRSVTRFTIGDRVAATLSYGAAAEFALVPEHLTFALPEDISFDEGAALPVNYMTAHFALSVRAQMKHGETVLVHGAAGGVGSAAVQIAAALGARTIAVVSSEEKAKFARESGAHAVVMADGFKDTVMQLSRGRGVDIVIDVVGARVIDDSLRCLAPGGRHMVLGFAGSDSGPPAVRVNRLLLRNIDVRGVGWGAHIEANHGSAVEQWEALLPLLTSRALRPQIGGHYELSKIRVALAELENRRAMGKIIVRVIP